ncbi:hypothetical protein U9029_06560 [Escherichia coli]|uniref:hypothetical protein n=1 Tax=Escherichia coli TaxID=562 RepID=UPI000B510B01|nr:hypothetical protein [Escherichia coli]EFB7253005.1 hypothetical protein [Escherichia coli]WIC11171.1 hypothetical protein QM040_10650 [Escherichia coli]
MSENKKTAGFLIEGAKKVHMTDCTSNGFDVGYSINADIVKMKRNSAISKDNREYYEQIKIGLIASKLDKLERELLLEKLERVNNQKDNIKRSAVYTDFITHAANHMTIVSAVWPVIVEFGKYISSKI